MGGWSSPLISIAFYNKGGGRFGGGSGVWHPGKKEHEGELFLDCLQWDEENVLPEEKSQNGEVFYKERR